MKALAADMSVIAEIQPEICGRRAYIEARSA
jgi:hypothetical protein